MTPTSVALDDGPTPTQPASDPRPRPSDLRWWFSPSIDGPIWIRTASVVALTLMTWPFQPGVSAGHGVDPSWEIALSMLHDRGAVWGRDVVFNYGPLGFLGFVNGANVAGWLVQILIAVTCAWLAVTLLSRAVSAPVAAIVTTAVFVLVYGPQPVPAIMRVVIVAALWSLDLVLRSDDVPVWKAIAAGAAWGAAMTLKADTGLVVAAVTGSAIGLTSLVVGGPRRAVTRIGWWVASGIAVVVVVFVTFGGPLAELGAWIRGSFEIVSGFSSGMSATRSAPLAIFEQVGAVALGVAVVVFAAREESLARARRLAAAAVAAVIVYLTFRQGFVRYDEWHVRQFSAVIAVVPFAFAGIWPTRRIAGLVLASLVVLVPGQQPSPSLALMPAHAVVWSVRSLSDLVRPEKLAELREQRAARTRAHYRVPASILDAVGDEPVAIVPENVEIANGYPDLNWVPLPVFQDYQANTRALDRLNTDFLASAKAPRWILRSDGAERVDRLFPRFDPPEENLELLCNYDIVAHTSNKLELLERRPDICGDPTEVARTRATLGRPVQVPAAGPDEMIVARFSGIDRGLLASLQASSFRGARYRMHVNDRSRLWRFTPGTQSGWHVLQAPACVDLGTTGPQIDRFTIEAPGRILGSEDYDVTFARIPVDCG